MPVCVRRQRGAGGQRPVEGCGRNAGGVDVVDVVAVVAASTVAAAASGWYVSAPVQFEKLRSRRRMSVRCAAAAAADEADVGRLPIRVRAASASWV
jgi:hypothetical protein